MAGLDARQIRALQQMFAQRADKDDGLATFRAGRLFIDEQTRMVTADKKRGKIKLLKDEQGLLKFQWFNRISNQKELDLTVFPQSAVWEKVNECTDGRVFVLRMIGSRRKHFFWMQEPKDDKDDEYFKNINKLCNGESISDAKPSTTATTASNPPSTANPAAANPYAAFGAGGGGQDALTQMIIDTLQRGGTGANNAAATGDAAANGGSGSGTGAGGQGNDLMEQMRDMMREQQRAAMEEMKREPDLEDILDPNANEEIIALLDDEKTVQELAQHLPASMRSRTDIIEQLQSPQFQGSLRRLQSAINGPQMPTLLSQMGVQAANQNAMGVTAFVNAIQPNEASGKSDAEQKEQEKQEKDKEKADKIDDDGDTDMTSKEDKDKEKDKDKNDDIDDIYK